MRVSKGIGLLLIAAAALAPGFASQLSLGGSSGLVSFSAPGPGQPISFLTGSSTITSLDSGLFENPTGTALLTLQPWSIVWIDSPYLAATSPDAFAITSGDSTFSFGDAGHHLTGIATFTKVGVIGPLATFVGTVRITTNNNLDDGLVGSALLTDYPVDATFPIFFLLNFGANPPLMSLWEEGGVTGGYIAVGAVPSPIDFAGTPEPGSLVLAGIGAAILWYRRRRA